MFESTVKQSIPRHIEPRRFAQMGVVLSGETPVDGFKRLSEAGVAVQFVQVDLVFSIADRRAKVVEGKITASVEMQCQRCLEPVSLEVLCDVALAVVWTEEAAKNLAGTHEPWLVTEEEADLYCMLEDELLLNLPIVAFHETDCVDRSLLSQGPKDDAKGTDKNNPFQVLKQLKETTKK